MANFGFGICASRAQPRGSHVVASGPGRVYRKDAGSNTLLKGLAKAAAHRGGGRPRVFLDVAIGDQHVGRIICELFSDITPKTAENFRLLCTGERGLGEQGKPLHYKGCPIHRVVPNFVIHGGDIVRGNGKGGESIYGPAFEDEHFDLRHTGPGLLTMANQGRPDSNNSQFYITLKACAPLDGKSVVFGKVVEGMEIAKRLEATCGIADVGSGLCPTPDAHEIKAFRNERTPFITDCGELLEDEEPPSDEEDDVRKLQLPRAKVPRLGSKDEEVHIFHMLKKHRGLRWPHTWQGKEASCTKGKAKLAVESLRKRLLASANVCRDFAELAKEHSDDGSSQRGGDLGLVERGELGKKVEDVCFSLPKGGLSEVFETDMGVHLVYRAA